MNDPATRIALALLYAVACLSAAVVGVAWCRANSRAAPAAPGRCPECGSADVRLTGHGGHPADGVGCGACRYWWIPETGGGE